jgi:hypothetical protein
VKTKTGLPVGIEVAVVERCKRGRVVDCTGFEALALGETDICAKGACQ